MQFYKERILNAAQLKRLSEHKYSCTSASILDAWLQPWWCWLVSKTPLWLAPNLITILGLIINIVTTLILVWYSPDARQDPPRWACALCALGVFIYQSLDAIDGKQARRTGSQSPLGELFDHGCDSISTVFIALGACIAVKLGEYPTWMFFQCFCAMTLFYCAHWQAYVTGTLKMGRIDVTEAQFSIIGIHLISSTLGADFWATQVGGGLEIRYSLALVAITGAFLTVGTLAAAIIGGGVGKNGSTVAIPVLGVPWCLQVSFMCYAAQFYFVLNFTSTFRVRGCGKNGSTVAILIALNFYARGSYQGSVGQNDDAPMAQQTVSRCIREVSLALNTPDILRKHIKFPQNATDRNVIKRKFYEKYNIPGVIGCIDCTHIAIVRPSEHEERFFNRKHFHSINTQVLPTLNINLNLFSNYGVVLLTLYLVVGYVRIIIKGGVGKNGSTVAGTSILSPVIPFSLVVVPAFIIFQKSESHVYENHPALYILAFGMVAAKVTNRLVVAHMTKSEMEYYDWSLLGPAMLFLNQYFNNAIPEYYVLWLCTIWVCVDLVRYCGQICLEICEHLKIRLFRIPYPPLGAATGKPAPAHAHAQSHAHAPLDRNASSDSEKSDFEDTVPLINNNKA